MDQRLANVLSSVFEIRTEQVNMGLTKESVSNWDSLTQLDLVVSLEQEFGVILEIEDVASMTSVEAIAGILRKLGVTLED
jgi:acyl carrier protein